MRTRPDGTPGRAGHMLLALIVGVVLAIIVVAVFALRQSGGPPARGRDALPSQAAKGSAGAGGAPMPQH